ncbi:ATP-binding protein [Niastella caeni]|uniref:ATP-binding protein n=1 Tax=Niastella caeni TaxID=2569763 RepID=A0A4S8HXV6_9BACT|nr:ATP-binding protein [Niastella caeni]THU40583.1 ATP-binding protein [Niastella caeni]
MLYPLHKHTAPSFGIEAALNDLRQIIVHRMQTHFNQHSLVLDKWLAETFGDQLIREEIIKSLPAEISAEEWITLLLSLVPHVQPSFFESIIAEHLPNGGDFAEFGGVKGSNHRSILPTGETVQFILAGTAIEQRLQIHQLFSEDHFFYRHGILWLEPVKEGEPVMSGRIVMAQDWIDKILLDKETVPRFGLDFPARRITTNMIWEDVVLNQQTRNYVNEISSWLQLHHKFNEDENLKRKIKPGYRVLFYGPSGTGKTLTAALLGKQFQKDVYRVDLSQVVSKYIGETEKNLESVFKKAETKNWILFFDEADALFGKRTNMQSAHDKYANQEVSYLLQRVEDYPGLLILATNFKSNLDEAFLRRFHSLIHFPMPNSAERLLLWQRSMPANLERHADIKLEELAKQYEISGASILNAVQYATLQTYARNNGVICQKDLIDGVRKEYLKEDKSF